MSSNSLRLAADLVVMVHVGFVAFVIFGGLLVLRRRRVAWLHVPAALWGIAIELGGWICPLTPLENSLRQHGGSTAYQGDFIEHYVLPVLYPAHLTRGMQMLLAGFALAVNLFVYLQLLRK